MVAFNEADLTRSIEAGALKRGRQTHANGLVIDFDVNSGETVITGRVRGSAPKPYRQVITLKAERTEPPFMAPAIVRSRITASMWPPFCSKLSGAWEKSLQQRRASAGRRAAASVVARPHGVARRSGGGGRRKSGCDDYPDDMKQRLIYVLKAENASTGRMRASISPTTAALLKGGSFGASPRFTTPAIFTIIRRPNICGPSIWKFCANSLGWRVRTADRPDTVSSCRESLRRRSFYEDFGTGRCRFGDIHGPVLLEGEARPAAARWLLQENGRQRLVFETAEDGEAGKPFESCFPRPALLCRSGSGPCRARLPAIFPTRWSTPRHGAGGGPR